MEGKLEGIIGTIYTWDPDSGYHIHDSSYPVYSNKSSDCFGGRQAYRS